MSTPFGTISSLFLRRCPADVAQFIVSVVVDAVETMFRRRASAKASEELRVRSKAEFNAATSVPMIFGAFWVIATVSGVMEGSVFRCDRAARPLTVSTVYKRLAFSGPASTGLAAARCQAVAWSDVEASAIAFAKPRPRTSMAASKEAKHKQSVEPQPSKDFDAVGTFGDWVEFC